MKKWSPLLGFGVLLFLWWGFDFLGTTNPIYFASPFETVKEAVNMIQTHSFWLDVWTTVRRVLLSFFFSGIIGIPTGILLGANKKTYTASSSALDFLRSIPPVVIYPLLFIAMGTGDNSRVFTAVFGGVAVAIMLIAKGLSLEDQTIRQFYTAKKVNRKDIFCHIVWYQALPHIMVAMRTVASLSLIVIVVTEMLIGDVHGLGTRIQNVQITSNIPDLFVSIICVGIIGIVLNKGIAILERRLIFWKDDFSS